jgi:nucleoside-diphosphate-sugar epimerase
MFVKTDQSTITIRGNGETQYPFTIRYDLGRVLAQTFTQPELYKNKWLTVANTWLSMNDIVRMINEVAGKNLPIRRLETGPDTPVLHLLEQNGWNVLPRETEELPVQTGDFQKVIKAYVDSELS